jgi:hypothetical protein
MREGMLSVKISGEPKHCHNVGSRTNFALPANLSPTSYSVHSIETAARVAPDGISLFAPRAAKRSYRKIGAGSSKLSQNFLRLRLENFDNFGTTGKDWTFPARYAVFKVRSPQP